MQTLKMVRMEGCIDWHSQVFQHLSSLNAESSHCSQIVWSRWKVCNDLVEDGSLSVVDPPGGPACNLGGDPCLGAYAGS